MAPAFMALQELARKIHARGLMDFRKSDMVRNPAHCQQPELEGYPYYHAAMGERRDASHSTNKKMLGHHLGYMEDVLGNPSHKGGFYSESPLSTTSLTNWPDAIPATSFMLGGNSNDCSGRRFWIVFHDSFFTCLVIHSQS
jgi:hypothetical protein